MNYCNCVLDGLMSLRAVLLAFQWSLQLQQCRKVLYWTTELQLDQQIFNPSFQAIQHQTTEWSPGRVMLSAMLDLDAKPGSFENVLFEPSDMTTQ